MKQADSQCPEVLSAHQKYFQATSPLHLRIQNFLFEPRNLLRVHFANLLDQVVFGIDFPLHPLATDDHLVVTFLQLCDMLIQINLLVL